MDWRGPFDEVVPHQSSGGGRGKISFINWFPLSQHLVILIEGSFTHTFFWVELIVLPKCLGSWNF